MSDQELLESAAKAAGYEVEIVADTVWINGDYRSTANTRPWNPLLNDAEALRLAISLNLSIIPHTHGVGWIDVGHVKELCGADPLAATRRAIVRAAANLAPPPNHKGE